MEGTLTAEETRTLLHAVSVEAEGLMRGLAEGLVLALAPAEMAAFANPIGRFFSAAKKVLRTAFLAAALTLIGSDIMDDETKEVFLALVSAQQMFLFNFQAEVVSGAQPPDGTLVARARQYGRAAWSVGQNTNRGIMGPRGATQERRVLGAEDGENCVECPELAALGWQPFLSLPNLGETPCRMNCRCWFETMDRSGNIRSNQVVFSTHKLRGAKAKDLHQRHARSKSSGHGYNPNRGPDGKFASGPHHDERGVWRGRSDGPTLHAGTEQYTPTRQAGVAQYARQTGREHGQDVRIAFTPPKNAREAALTAKATKNDRHLVETTVEPKYRTTTSTEGTQHHVGGELASETIQHPDGKRWVVREHGISSVPGEHLEETHGSRVRAEKAASRSAQHAIRQDTDRFHRAPKDVHDHFERVSGEYRNGIADTHTVRHRIVTREA
jgi:hypothetical protein